MKKRHFSPHAAVLLFSILIALSGCSSKKIQPVVDQGYYDDDPYSFEAYLNNRNRVDRSSMTEEQRFAYDNRTASLAHMRQEGVPISSLHLVEQAKSALGIPYVSGGTSTDGFDCSGFVQWAYGNVGVRIPRTAREQSVVGRAIGADSMKAGDIVAFNHPQRGYHTGIYLGNGRFIHSPGRGKSVSIAHLTDPYFSATFIGARRIRSSESDADAVRHLMALDDRVRRDVPGSNKRSASTRHAAAEAESHASARQAKDQKVATVASRSSQEKASPAQDRKAVADNAKNQKAPDPKNQKAEKPDPKNQKAEKADSRNQKADPKQEKATQVARKDTQKDAAKDSQKENPKAGKDQKTQLVAQNTVKSAPQKGQPAKSDPKAEKAAPVKGQPAKQEAKPAQKQQAPAAKQETKPAPKQTAPKQPAQPVKQEAKPAQKQQAPAAKQPAQSAPKQQAPAAKQETKPAPKAPAVKQPAQSAPKQSAPAPAQKKPDKPKQDSKTKK